jgi:hypothetical protein
VQLLGESRLNVAEMETVDPQDFRDVISHLASGVTVYHD